MPTPIEEVIHFLQTFGDSFPAPANYAGRQVIRFAIDPTAGGGMTGDEVTMARAAFALWDDLIAPRFLEVINPLEADIIFHYGELDPQTAGQSNDVFFPLTGQKLVTINRLVYSRGEVIEFGSQPFKTYIHEIGHALGLSHPGPYNGSFFGTAQYGEDNVYEEDFQLFTVMSYFTLFEVEEATGVRWADWFNAFPMTPMLHDVATIQHIYGASTDTRTGDTVYGFNANVLTFDMGRDDLTSRAMAFTIWDSGGIDTIDASGAQAGPGESIFNVPDSRFPDQMIDLAPGAFSSIGLSPPGLVRIQLVNNVTIALGTIIENAIGGGGNDTISGNAVANTLRGGAGADTLSGLDGNDILMGENGDDSLMGGNGNDHLVGGLGNDTLTGGSGNDLMEGGFGADRHFGGTGIDTVSYANAATDIQFTAQRQSGDAAGDTFSSIERYILTSFADRFQGQGTGETFFAGGGDDDVDGRGGNEVIHGEAGDDVLAGGTGDDHLLGGAGIDRLLGGDGSDILDGGAGGDAMAGGAGDDTYLVDDPADTVTEGNLFTGDAGGIDTVSSFVSFTLPVFVENLTLLGAAPLNATGNLASNTLLGNGAANVLDGGFGTDILIGRGGNDTYIVDNIEDVVDESSGSLFDIDTVLASVSHDLSDTRLVRGSVENLTLTGSGANRATGNALANTLTGNAAANILIGNAGNDVLDGGAGADAMFGGTGNDTYIVDNVADRVDETGGGSLDVDTVRSSVSFSLVTLSQAQGVLENLVLTGTAAISGTGNEFANRITGNAAANVLDGLAGNDTLDGGQGNDALNGGTGNDTYVFFGSNQGSDVFTDSGGADTVIISAVRDVVSAVRSGNDLVVKMSYGVFRIAGHFMTGGSIEAVSDPARSVVLATSTIGGSASGLIAGTSADERLSGRGGDDLLYGRAGSDLLLGGQGDDRISGGGGHDRIVGGRGADELTGGRGRDTFAFARVSESPDGGHDIVTDFETGLDVIDLSLIDADVTVDGGQAFDFIGGASFTAAGQLRFADGLLEADIDGDGGADLVIALRDVTGLAVEALIL